MSYLNIRQKLNKFSEGGKIPKYDRGSAITEEKVLSLSDGGASQTPGAKLYNARDVRDYGHYASGVAQQTLDESEDAPGDVSYETRAKEANAAGAEAASGAAIEDKKADRKAAAGDFMNKNAGAIAGGAIAATSAVDEALMGDKNFGAQSQAIDSAVHGVSGALMSSGNPYAMAAGAALEGANFLTKAGGQTVQGFDVDINNSGYGNLGHMESSSSRDFGAMIGLGGLNRSKTEAKLARRNEQARMALAAAAISEDQSFEQEARMNSIQNVIINNQIALAGGVDVSGLGS